MPKNAVCLKVPKKQGEAVIILTAKLGLMDKALIIGRDDEYLFVPLNRQPEEAELANLKAQVPTLEVTSGDFEENKQPFETLEKALQGKLPPDLFSEVPQ